MQSLSVISEGGLYKSIIRSNLPKAEEFTDWVVDEVLPAIRKTGSYSIADYYSKKEVDACMVRFIETKWKPLKAKAALIDMLEVSDDCIKIGDFAKLMCQNGFDVGRTRAFEALRKNGWLSKQGKENLPTQKAIDRGYFKIKETIGNGVVFRTPVMTGKGQVYFLKRANKILAQEA